MNNASRTIVMGWNKSRECKTLGDQALSELIVDAKRAAWILKMYPPDEMGRPGIHRPYEPRRGSTQAKRSPELDEERQALAEIEVSDARRITPPEFERDEGSLEQEEVEMAVAAD